MLNKDISRPILLRCHSCSALNSVPAPKLSAHPNCGKCHTPLHISTSPLNITTQAFNKMTSAWPEFILLDFWSKTCGYCQMVEPVLKELASSHPGLLMVARVDIDDETELARRFNVTATPTFILQRKGTQLARMDGAPKENTDLIAWANQFLK